MAEWDAVVKEWLIDTGCCNGGGLASAEDGVMYAAASDGTVDPWTLMYADDHEEDSVEEDGVTVKKVTINEGATILSAVNDGKAPDGLYIGATKYKVVRPEPAFEYNDCTFSTCTCAKPKGGCHLIKTAGGSIVVALFDEDAGFDKGSSQNSALQFAEYLNSSGY